MALGASGATRTMKHPFRSKYESKKLLGCACASLRALALGQGLGEKEKSYDPISNFPTSPTLRSHSKETSYYDKTECKITSAR
jgi:hypothetical protein